MTGRTAAGTLLSLLVFTAARRPAGAQEGARPGPRLVVRADAILARATSVQGAVGLTLPLGNYVRLDAVGGGGVERSSGASRGSARADLVARFVFDPFRQARRGAYAGAGLGALRSEGSWGAYLLAVAGVEGPPAGPFLPAVELGLGRGLRFGVVLRGAVRGRR